ncbi:MAG: twin-arginine translocase TatA/TatE family subunit [archaeon]|nr:twin-arginine translocase TatA/TatE family subunit [archaeon]
MSIGMPEILVVLVIVLILFGPKKLPQLARAIGEAFSEYKKGMKGVEEEEGSRKEKDARKKKGKKRTKKLAG